jgi:hypothetical protein
MHFDPNSIGGPTPPPPPIIIHVVFLRHSSEPAVCFHERIRQNTGARQGLHDADLIHQIFRV